MNVNLRLSGRLVLEGTAEHIGSEITSQLLRPMMNELNAQMPPDQVLRAWLGLMGSLTGGMHAALGDDAARHIVEALQDIVRTRGNPGGESTAVVH